MADQKQTIIQNVAHRILAQQPQIVRTIDHGDCVPLHDARRIVVHYGVFPREHEGALIFQYRGEDERRVEPIFTNDIGWLYPIEELEPRSKIDG